VRKRYTAAEFLCQFPVNRVLQAQIPLPAFGQNHTQAFELQYVIGEEEMFF
jgi:hypothetical protein